MTSERWHQITGVFHAALARNEADRSAFLASACGDDAGLRRDVESMIAAHHEAGQFGETPVFAPPPPSLEPGSSVGPYRVEQWLGSGGMGQVYRARDTRLGRTVALKILAPELAHDPDFRSRFEREARTISQLDHHHICALYDVGDQDGTAYLVMQHLEGETLAQRLERGVMPIEAVLTTAAQIADALDGAHTAGVIHRDLKPANVFLTRSGVKLLDFGLASSKSPLGASAVGGAPQETALTTPGLVFGTVPYMAPEQLEGKEADARSDLFALGTVIYEMVTGRKAFDGEHQVDVISSIMTTNPPPMSTVRTGVPGEFDRVVAACLAKDPEARWQSARDVKRALAWILEPATGPGAVAPAVGVTRRRALWLTGAAATTVAAGLGAWRLWPQDTGIRVLAVLPFTNVANDKDVEYLCDGITESLIHQITRLRSLTVLARSTVFNFKGKTFDPRDTGRQLGVDAILTGTVTSRSGRLRITAELVEVATGVQLWGNTYDRAAAEVVSVQDEIASAIMDEGIRLRLSGDERRRLVRHFTDDPQAYEWYWRARHSVLRGSEEDILQGRELLVRATTRDPQFALAHNALAATYVATAIDGFERPADAWPLANVANRRALALDSELPEAHATTASVAFLFAWDWATAEREWKIATDAPSGAFPTNTLLIYPMERWALGRPDDAVRIMRKIRQADPLTPYFAMVEADYLFHSGQLDAAVDLYEQTIQDEPSARALFGLAEVRCAQGRFDEAIEARRRGHQAAGDDSLRDVLETARGAEGYRQIETRAARQELEALQSRAATAYVSPLDFARAHAQLGQSEQAFSYFDAAFADRAPGLVFLTVDRSWDAIRGDPRFLAAVRRVGLP